LKGLKNMIRTLILLAILCIFFVGCQANENKKENAGGMNNDITQINTEAGNNQEKKKKLSSSQIAKRLVKIATADVDVKDATAIVAGKYAIVGIDVDKDIDRSKVGTIKFTITEALQKDPYGANAVVTADADIVTRLKGMAKEIRNGKPIIGVMEELAAIIGRIIPEVPDKSHKAKVEPTEENEDKLPEGKENELDEEQDDQANHQLQNRDGKEEQGSPENGQPQETGDKENEQKTDPDDKTEKEITEDE
jgi:YhcN/YlaJ family sporulation lipoprotein